MYYQYIFVCLDKHKEKLIKKNLKENIYEVQRNNIIVMIWTF